MNHVIRGALASAAACLALAAPAAIAQQNQASPGQSPARGANPDPALTVQMQDSQGKPIGTVELRQLNRGLVLIADLQGLPPGPHGFHIHERGVCDAPDFKSAGGHYSPRQRQHGFDSPRGYHVGDLPNLHVGRGGTARAEFHTTLVTLAPEAHAKQNIGGPAPYSLLDRSGSALIIHAKGDDYQASTPDSTGSRIACGVIAAPR